MTWAKFLDHFSDRGFFFFNTHFDHVGQIARERSARLLLKKIKEIAGDGPVIVTGDFNCTSDETPYLILTAEANGFPGLEDTQNISGNGHYGGTQTFNGFSENGQTRQIINFFL